MEIISDFHIHSKYSRACSKQTSIENLEKYARIKGVTLLGTGDFQHPLWNKEIKEKLTETEDGILKTKTGFSFILSTELSLMYTQDGKGRRIHFVLLAPKLSVVDQIIATLRKRGRLDYDGRPIFGFSAIELVDMMKEISSKIEIIPAHIWTPWFGVLGSKSGFDSIEECFKEKTKYIHAVETGLSSDPPLNWRLKALDKFNLVSFSDAHSFWPWRIGREATVFDTELKYDAILNAIRTGKGLVKTIETDPSYGKYHFDGHRNCNISFSPEETKKYNGICPKCGKPLTIGVLYRVNQLADRPLGEKSQNAKEFIDLIPLSEIISLHYGVKQLYSQRVWGIFNQLIAKFGTEFNVLLNAPKEEISELLGEKFAELIMKNREGKIKVKPGYDGVYGEPLFKEKQNNGDHSELRKKYNFDFERKQKSLDQF